MNTLKLMLFGWPLPYIGLVYLPLRYGIAVGWVCLFVYLSEFGCKLCKALYKLVEIRLEDWVISRNSSL